MTALDKKTKILIIGGGTFGLSTALWLLRDAYEDITVIDPYKMPSQISAGYDINKIVQSTYTNVFTTKLALESLELWKNDPVFKPCFHEVGVVYASTTQKPFNQLVELNKSRTAVGKKQLEPLDTNEEFRAKASQISGPLPGWRGFYQEKECGWAHALNALIRTSEEIVKLGGKFVVGEVNGLIYKDGLVEGCTTKDGDKILAEKTIISAGASSTKIMDFKDQLLAKCWTVGHIKLTDIEAQKFKDTPVVINLEKGFFFEPDTNNELKFCNEFPGYTNYVRDEKNPASSTPIKKNAIPVESENEMRDFLRETLPELADRPFIQTKICWCTDTPDRNFLIGEHPDYQGSLVLATGDSGHGFKHMPAIGKHIANLVMKGEKGLDEEKLQKWRWRPETIGDRVQDRHGGTGILKDLHEIEEWYNADDKLEKAIGSLNI